jgi:hypothetical protein
MPARNETRFDLAYLKNLYDSLANSNRAQAETLSDLSRHVGEMGVLLRAFDKKQTEQDKALGRHSDRIRAVELGHAQCSAKSEIKGIWHHVKRMNAFKDMIMDKSREDSQAIDLHALRMQEAIARDQASFSFKNTAIKWVPWLVVAFAMGVALATVFVVQTVSGQTLVPFPSTPKIQLQDGVHSSAQDKE